MESHRQEIDLGRLVVFFLDECHLLWGDTCGYVWGKTNQRIEVPVVNERQKQTDYGALNLCTQEFWLKAYEKGNSEFTIAFIHYLLAEYLSVGLRSSGMEPAITAPKKSETTWNQ